MKENRDLKLYVDNIKMMVFVQMMIVIMCMFVLIKSYKTWYKDGKIKKE